MSSRLESSCLRFRSSEFQANEEAIGEVAAQISLTPGANSGGRQGFQVRRAGKQLALREPDQALGICDELRTGLQLVRISLVVDDEIVQRDEPFGMCLRELNEDVSQIRRTYPQTDRATPTASSSLAI